MVLFRIIRGHARLAGGALAHIGIALLLIGFITSGKYDTVQSYALPKNQAVEVFGYNLTYKGPSERDGKGAYRITAEKAGNEYQLDPIFYFSTYSQAWMKSPDILAQPTYDIYIAPVTVEITGQRK